MKHCTSFYLYILILVFSPGVHFAFQVPPSALNPFLQQHPGAFVQSQITGANGAFIQAQPTGFIQPQHTAIPVNPFSHSQPSIQQTSSPFQGNQFPQIQQPAQFNTSPLPPRGILQNQPTGFLQPQVTGSNPFRQSILIPQSTGFPSSGIGAIPPLPSLPASSPTANFTELNNFGRSRSPPIGPSLLGTVVANPTSPVGLPNRPQSTPLPNLPQTQPFTAVTAHQTGSKNPFGQPVKPAPPVPKPPTLQELVTGAFTGNLNNNTTATNNAGSTFAGSNLFGSGSIANPPRPSSPQASSQSFGPSVMSSIASSFTTKPTPENTPANSYPFLTSQNTSTTNTTSDFSNSLSVQPTGSTAPTTAFSISSLQSQPTGFGGIKPFKPTSTFGASLLESLPPIADTTSLVKPAMTGVTANPTGFRNLSATAAPLSNPANPLGLANSSLPFQSATDSNTQNPILGALNAQTTGKQLFGSNGNGSFNSPVSPGSAGASFLRPQMTGGGSANPFRASMAVPSSSATPFSSSVPLPNFSAFPQTNIPASGLTGNGAALFKSNFPGFGQPQFNLSIQQDASKVNNESLI